MPNTTLRKATLYDLPVLWDLWLKLTSEESANESISGREMYPAVVPEDKEQWGYETALILSNPQALLLLAESDGEPAGFMLSSINTRTVGHPKQFVLVHQLYVRPADRRAALGNVAELLQNASTKWALSHNITAVELDCVQSNQTRWQKLGFTTAAVRMYKTLET